MNIWAGLLKYSYPLECHVTHLQKITANNVVRVAHKSVLLIVCSYSLCSNVNKYFSNVHLAESQFYDVGDCQGIYLHTLLHSTAGLVGHFN